MKKALAATFVLPLVALPVASQTVPYSPTWQRKQIQHTPNVLGARKDSGVVCNGTADDAAAIQDAVNRARFTGGATVQLPAGTCNVSSTITIGAANTYIRGAGQFATTIKTTSGSTDVFKFYNATPYIFGGISDLAITHTGTATDGAGIHIKDVGAIAVQNVRITGTYNGIVWEQGKQGAGTARTVHVSDIQHDAYQVLSTNGVTFEDCTTFQNYVMNGGPGPANAGWHVRNGAGIKISNSSSSSQLYGLLVDPGEGDDVVDFWVTAVDFDDSKAAAVKIDSSSGTGKARDIIFSSARAGFANDGTFTNGLGVWIKGSGSKGIVWNGGEVVKNTQAGIQIDGGTNITFSGVYVASNSIAGNSLYSGVEINGGDNLNIVGVTSGNYTDGQGNGQQYGINVKSGFTGVAIITGSNLRGNTTGGISNAGNGTVTVGQGNVGLNAPTIGSCAAATVVPGSNDFAGSISLSGPVSTCSINFSTKQSMQSCIAMSTTRATMSLVALSSASVTFGLTPAQSLGTITYLCATY